MSLARPKGRLGRAYKPHHERLMKDGIVFARAIEEFGPPTTEERVSLGMVNSLARWLRDAERALDRIERLPANVEGRVAAIRALKTLVAGLTHMAYSFQVTDATQAEAEATTAELEMRRWTKLSDDLERRL